MPDGLKHIFIDQPKEARKFSSSGRGSFKIQPRERNQHGERLRRKLDDAYTENRDQAAASLRSKDGVYLKFESAPGYDLVVKSLEDRGAGIRLLNVQEVTREDKVVTEATVYVPAGKEHHFAKKLRQYQDEQTQAGKPKNEKLINSIENIRLAVLESFWQDRRDLIPEERDAKWCEIWFRDEESSGEESINAPDWFDILGKLDIESQEGELRFPERTVVLAKANRVQLNKLIEASPNIAEFRLAKETAHFFLELSNKEQIEWVEDLLSRLSVSKNPRVAVTILDTGADNGHRLLEPILADEDCLTVDPSWGTTDHEKHGTLICGLAGYGDLQEAIESRSEVEVAHCLESVKIVPPRGENEQKLYGHITSQGISRAEIQAPRRDRIACLAITSKDDLDRGRPSSWSAAVDQLAFGHDGKKRLFCVAAGNVEGEAEWKNYHDSNLTSSIHDPGQSWNALTVGAFTKKARLTNPDLADHKPIAPADGLSPFSSTSLVWDKKKWPIKPDIVFEGGNVAKDSTEFVSGHDDLSILTTASNSTRSQFDYITATSAATAQVSWMAAQIQARYPDAWPETVRGLMVHSAEWTEKMRCQFLRLENKGDYANLLRVCGYGVPNLVRALNCFRDQLTLICQGEIQPFDKEGSSCRMKEMHLHELPWPKEELLSLGQKEVALKITLSYFVEPAPGEIGWNDRYRYASHALRFNLINVNEDRKQFLQRINRAEREEGERPDSSSGSDRWLIGSNARDIGSIHSDVWISTAADLATCHLVGVYPVSGWWRGRDWLGKWGEKARYSLIVSIEAPETGVDIYTPVANMVGIPISISEQ